MYPGNINGAAGGGIYFADNPKATDDKTEHEGPILKCYVYIGVQCTMTYQQSTSSLKGQNATYIWQWMHQDGRNCDSILVTGFSSGYEYVVYQSSQVTDISLYKPGKPIWEYVLIAIGNLILCAVIIYCCYKFCKECCCS